MAPQTRVSTIYDITRNPNSPAFSFKKSGFEENDASMVIAEKFLPDSTQNTYQNLVYQDVTKPHRTVI